MHAVVSLFDKNSQTLRPLSRELEKNFGTHLYDKMPDPHLSYQGATEYDFAKLESLIRRFAKRTRGFQVHAGGIGIFTGLTPTLYIPVVRTPELSRFQLSLLKSISSSGSGLSPYYMPEAWVPHMTLARGISKRTLTRVIGRISRKEIELDIKIDNVAIIALDGKRHKILSKFQLARH